MTGDDGLRCLRLQRAERLVVCGVRILRNRAVDLWREENPAKAQTLDCISDRIKIVALVDSCGI